MAKLKRILLECTRTYEDDVNTGIQRVVRNILRESHELSKEYGVIVVPVLSRYGFFFKADNRKSIFTIYQNKCVNFLKKMYGALRPAIMNLSSSGFLEKLIFNKISYCILFILNALFCPFLLAAYYRKRIFVAKDDLLLLLDSSWVYPIWPAVKRAKENDATVGLVLYDLIPIMHHDFFFPIQIERFEKWTQEAVQNVDFIMAISKTVANDMREYIQTYAPDNQLKNRIDSFVLGSKIDKATSQTPVREKVQNIFTSDNNLSVYLAVSTIEPRKNYGYLLDAFDRIWKKFPDARLLIVGRTGYKSDAFLKRVASHQLHEKSLYMFHDISDCELDYCYQNAKALIFPSHAEGFGLPIVEALFKGLPVFASDIPIFREVGRDFCTYFDQTNPDSLADIICKIESEGKMPPVAKPEKLSLTSWTDSCRELLTKSLALCQHR